KCHRFSVDSTGHVDLPTHDHSSSPPHCVGRSGDRVPVLVLELPPHVSHGGTGWLRRCGAIHMISARHCIRTRVAVTSQNELRFLWAWSRLASGACTLRLNGGLDLHPAGTCRTEAARCLMAALPYKDSERGVTRFRAHGITLEVIPVDGT